MIKFSTKALLSLIVVCLFFPSCSSDDSSDSERKAPYIRFSIAETDYDFEDILSGSGGEAGLSISGTNRIPIAQAGHAKLVLYMPGDLTTGSFTISPGNFNYDELIPEDTYKISLSEETLDFFNDFASSGSITITEIFTEFVEGTFSATIPNKDGATVNINNGRFRAVYIR